MPTPTEYATAFGLITDLQLAGYQLVDWEIEHHQEVLFNEYSYPTTLTFRWLGNGEPNPERLIDAVLDYTDGIRVVYSASGRPYQTLFQTSGRPMYEERDGLVILYLTGYSKRISQAAAAKLLK